MRFLALFLAFSLISISADANIKNQDISDLKKDLDKIQTKLDLERAKVSKIRATIKSLEGQIVSSHKKHQTLVDKVTGVQSLIEELEVQVAKSENSIKKQYKKMKRVMAHYLINFTSEDTEVDGVFQSQVYKKFLKGGIKKLKSNIEESKKNQEQARFLKERLQEIKKTENQMYSFMLELEQKKKNAASTYVGLVEKHHQLEDEFIKKKSTFEVRVERRKKYRAKKMAKFQLPLKDYIRYEATKKGVNFYYSGNRAIYSPDSGKVVYLGELSSYGTVIMLEHNDEIRSVFLGNIVAKVKKGERVEKGQVLGQTFFQNLVKKPLYFEVRKKNIAQNTALWLEKI